MCNFSEDVAIYTHKCTVNRQIFLCY